MRHPLPLSLVPSIPPTLPSLPPFYFSSYPPPSNPPSLLPSIPLTLYPYLRLTLIPSPFTLPLSIPPSYSPSLSFTLPLILPLLILPPLLLPSPISALFIGCLKHGFLALRSIARDRTLPFHRVHLERHIRSVFLHGNENTLPSAVEELVDIESAGLLSFHFI